MNRKEWNKLAKTFEKNVCDISREETADQIKRYVARAKIPKSGAVLVDMGCGIGTFIRQYQLRCFTSARRKIISPGLSSWVSRRKLITLPHLCRICVPFEAKCLDWLIWVAHVQGK